MPPITLDIFEAYPLCPRKAFLLQRGEPVGVPHEYARIIEEQEAANRQAHRARLAEGGVVVPFGGPAEMAAGWEIVADADLSADGLHARCDFLTKLPERSRFRRFSYEPVKVIGSCRASRPDALGLAYLGLVLGEVQGRQPSAGTVVLDGDRPTKVKLSGKYKEVRRIVEVLRASPLAGTYARPDPLALLRTGYRFGDPALKDVRAFERDKLDAAPDDQVHLKLERGGSIVAESSFRLIASADGIKFDEASGPGWHAVYARPGEAKTLRRVITLHGSEGGSVDKARGRAAQWASQGFAALAVNYFTQTYEPIKGVPSQHIDIKVEVISSARDWLAARPEVDGSRFALYGVSKGAEFALLAATRYEWITAVVAVVPSDVVWEGYAADAGQNTARSSWSVGGEALPFVPLFAFDAKQEGLYRTNTERYQRSRAFHADRVAAARIPVEKTGAKLLLLASDRDEVWASGAMARSSTTSSSATRRARCPSCKRREFPRSPTGA